MITVESAVLRPSQDYTLRLECQNRERKAAERKGCRCARKDRRERKAAERKRSRWARNDRAACGVLRRVSLVSVRLKSSQDSSLALGMTRRPTGVLRRVSLVSAGLKPSHDSSLRSE